MIRTAITKTSAILGATTATLAMAATPAFAHLIEYKPVAKFGAAGSAAGQFNRPAGVAIDEGDGDVYVVDQGNNRVERLESDGTYISEIDGGETPEKSFSEPTYVAVDNSEGGAKGHVYVADPNQGVVDAFDSSGKYLFQIKTEQLKAITTDASGHLWTWTGQASFEEYSGTGSVILRHPTAEDEGSSGSGIALDSKGNVYVLTGGCIDRYSPPGFEHNGEARVCDGGSFTLAIDPASDNVFQDSGSSVVEWPPFGEGPGLWERTEELIGGAFTNSRGLAVDGSTGRIYVSDESADEVEVLDGTPPAPPVIEGAPVALRGTRSSAVIESTIDGSGSYTTYYVLYVESASYGPSATNPYAAGGASLPSAVPTGSGGQPVQAILGGLKPNTTYHYQLVTVNQAGRVTGPDETFTTGAQTPPAAVTGGASGVAQNSATIAGTLNTSGLPTAYGFEVGTSTDYGPPAGLGSVGAGLSEAQVSLALTGLQPGTTYHYRLTATNVDGTSYGVDQTFTTGVFATTFAVPPAPLPFVAVPAIAFPAEAKGSTTTTPKALTNAQELAAALKACNKKPKKQRAGCQKQARKKYAPVKKARKGKK
jgi:hypothetical protein